MTGWSNPSSAAFIAREHVLGTTPLVLGSPPAHGSRANGSLSPGKSPAGLLAQPVGGWRPLVGAAGAAGTRSALVLPEKVAQLLAQREAETLSPVAGQAGFHGQSEAGGHSSFALVRWRVDCQSAWLLCLQGRSYWMQQGPRGHKASLAGSWQLGVKEGGLLGSL